MNKRTKKPDPESDLHAFRLDLGLTLRQLAKVTSISPATLHRMEKGYPVSMRSRVKLQDSLGLIPQEIDRLVANRPATRSFSRKRKSTA